MKIKAVSNFRDKNTNILYKTGQELEVTQKRFLEINGTVYGVLAEEIKEEKEHVVNKRATKK